MSTKKVHFVGKDLRALASCLSTNDFAISFLKKGNLTEGTVFYTTNQTQGKGQAGTNWVSEPYKNIAFTTVLFPRFLFAREQTYLNQAIAIACARLLKSHTRKEVHIKWPNDIYINGKKAIGILIQNTISSNKLNTSVVGIGINVNQENFPKELSKATSLYLQTGQIFNLRELVLELCEYLNEEYYRLKEQQFSEIYKNYEDWLYRKGEKTNFQRANGVIFEGIIEGVNKSGQLLIQTNSGVEVFNLKEISML